MPHSEPAGAQIARERLAVVREQLAEVQKRLDDLVVRSPSTGVVVTRNPEQMLGSYVRRGEPLCEVVDVTQVHIAAVMDQRQAGWLADVPRNQYKVEIRPVSEVSRVMEGSEVRFPGAGNRILPSRALGIPGGGKVETEAKDESGRVAKRPVFPVEIEPVNVQELLGSSLPGTRVHVRFTLEDRPWLWQWWERLEREIQGRVKL